MIANFNYSSTVSISVHSERWIKNRENDKIPCFSYLSGYTIYCGKDFWRGTGYFSILRFSSFQKIWYIQSVSQLSVLSDQIVSYNWKRKIEFCLLHFIWFSLPYSFNVVYFLSLAFISPSISSIWQCSKGEASIKSITCSLSKVCGGLIRAYRRNSL